MTVIKCKMCGGNIVRSANNTYGMCDSCGSTMTLPKIDDEQRAAAFNRGNHFRRIGEFDKALTAYESIVREDDSDAEAHWCCALCRFGIEYVEDPATYEWLPTCHRASFDSFLEDVDYLAALEHSDGITRRQYQKDGAKIAEVQRGILATSQNEEPFDVFICYKESDENGQRTRDSLLAQEIYYQLTEQGRRVFFARITLEDKVGTEYEPYIFAALNSAKVMVAVGTKAEHFSAVWVKNEWSRFLALMRMDRGRLLLPCYRDMDPYDLPEQLSVLQSYDMAKIGFIQDLIRGISKVLDAEKAPQIASVTKETVVVQREATGNADALLKRGYLALEDGEWTAADEFFEQVLNQNAECAEAYLGKALAAHKCRGVENLCDALIESVKIQPSKEVQAVIPDKQHVETMVGKCAVPYYQPEESVRKMYDYPVNVCSEVDARTAENEFIRNFFCKDKNLTRASSHAGAEFKKKLDELQGELEQKLSQRVVDAKKDELTYIRERRDAYQAFLERTDVKVKECYEKALNARERDYQETVAMLNGAKTVADYENARDCFLGERLKGYKDCAELAKKCEQQISTIEETQGIILKEQERRKKLCVSVLIAVGILIVAVGLVAHLVIKHQIKSANMYFEDGLYQEGFDLLTKVKGEEYAHTVLTEHLICDGETLLEAGDYDGGYELLARAVDSGYAEQIVDEYIEKNARILLENKQYEEGKTLLCRCMSEEDAILLTDEYQVKHVIEEIKTTPVGQTVLYGSYEFTWNKPEDISWIVLEKTQDKALLISELCIKAIQITENTQIATWEDSVAREWLNYEFYENSFTTAEKNNILGTSDNIFLLNKTEIEKYFNSEEERVAFAHNGKAVAWWRGLNTGEQTQFHEHVGVMWPEINPDGENCFYTVHGKSYVRPAMWIDLS